MNSTHPRSNSLIRLLGCACLAAALSLSVAADTSQEQPAAQKEAPKNTLKWSTASEVDNFGYDVYRGDQEEGPFTRITKDPIPGNGTTDETSEYKYIDTDIDPTRAYYYYVESISIDGERERFTPVFKARAKQPPADAENEPRGEEDNQGS